MLIGIISVCKCACTVYVSHRTLLRTYMLIYIQIDGEFLSFYYWYLETLQIEHAKIANGHVANNIVKWISCWFEWKEEEKKNCDLKRTAKT